MTEPTTSPATPPTPAPAPTVPAAPEHDQPSPSDATRRLVRDVAGLEVDPPAPPRAAPTPSRDTSD